MTFITFSLLLGGLAAAAIPVLLHLLMRGKPRIIEFPALMFLKKRLDVQKRRNRLKHLILLAMRVLACVLIGLALARPSVKLADWFPSLTMSSAQKTEDGRWSFVGSIASSLGSQEAPIAAAVVVDSSIRMDYVQENQARLDVARDFSRWILEQIPTGSDIAILSCEREAAVFQVDVLAAKEKIDRLQITPMGRTVADAVQDALNLLAESENEQRELYIVTDLTEPGWPGDLGRTLQNVIEGLKPAAGMFGPISDKELGIFVVDVGTETPINSSIVRFQLTPEAATVQTPVRIDLEISHLGPASDKTVEVVLMDGANERIRTSKNISFPEGESKRSLTFPLAAFDPGTHQGKLRFSVPDALSADDEAWFTVQVQTPWKLLLLAPPPVRESSLYLLEALKTAEMFDFETAALSTLSGMTMREMEGFRGIILLDPDPMPAPVWKKLADYASSGHGVAIFLGARANDLASFNDPTATEVLGAKLVQQAREPDGELWFVPEGETSPVFSPFRQYRRLETFPWDALPVFRYWQLSDLSPRAEVAASFLDSRPAIITQPQGRGNVVTVTTPVSETAEVRNPWNLWSRTEAPYMFFLLAEGIAKQIIGVGDQCFNYEAGRQVVLRPNVETFPATCLMGTPSGKSVRLSPDTVLRQIVVPTTSEPGNYRIRSGGVQESLDTGFSVNLPGGVTNLRRIGKDRLDSLLGEKNYKLVRTPQEIELGIARRRVGQELFPAIMLLLAALFAAEYIFSNRFYGFTATSGTTSPGSFSGPSSDS